MTDKIGMVKAVVQREKGFSLLMDENGKDEWFGGFGKLPCSKYDKVQFGWLWNDDIDKRFRNIKGDVKVLEKGAEAGKEDPKSSEPLTLEDIAKDMEWCLNKAAEILKPYCEGYVPGETLTNVADTMFIQYYYRRR